LFPVEEMWFSQGTFVDEVMCRLCHDALICHNVQRKLDGLGKEKEEASKEIDNLTKQIEELRSSAGLSFLM